MGSSKNILGILAICLSSGVFCASVEHTRYTVEQVEQAVERVKKNQEPIELFKIKSGDYQIRLGLDDYTYGMKTVARLDLTLSDKWECIREKFDPNYLTSIFVIARFGDEPNWDNEKNPYDEFRFRSHFFEKDATVCFSNHRPFNK